MIRSQKIAADKRDPVQNNSRASETKEMCSTTEQHLYSVTLAMHLCEKVGKERRGDRTESDQFPSRMEKIIENMAAFYISFNC